MFKDVDSIPAGRDFREVILEAISDSEVVLAVIGERWLSIQGDSGRPRLEDPDLKENVRARLLRAQYLCKVVLAAMALGIQGWFCSHLVEELGRGGP